MLESKPFSRHTLLQVLLQIGFPDPGVAIPPLYLARLYLLERRGTAVTLFLTEVGGSEVLFQYQKFCEGGATSLWIAEALEAREAFLWNPYPLPKNPRVPTYDRVFPYGHREPLLVFLEFFKPGSEGESFIKKHPLYFSEADKLLKEEVRSKRGVTLSYLNNKESKGGDAVYRA